MNMIEIKKNQKAENLGSFLGKSQFSTMGLLCIELFPSQIYMLKPQSPLTIVFRDGDVER